MKVHGMNAQIKFLKIAMNQKFSMERINEEKSRREGVRSYQRELQELMIKSSINQETLLQLFGESVQLLYNKMWKMFCWNDSLMAMGEDLFESFMNFINTGVGASEELHDILIKYIPENQRKNFLMLPVEVK